MTGACKSTVENYLDNENKMLAIHQEIEKAEEMDELSEVIITEVFSDIEATKGQLSNVITIASISIVLVIFGLLACCCCTRTTFKKLQNMYGDLKKEDLKVTKKQKSRMKRTMRTENIND